MADAPAPASDPGRPPSPDRTPTTSTRAPLTGALFFLIGLVASTVAPELGWSLVLRLLVPVIALVGAVVLFAYAGTALHRDQVQTRGQLLTAWAATAVLLGGYVWLTVQASGFWMTFLTTACLATAATISLRTVLIPRPPLGDTFESLMALQFGVTVLSVGYLTDSDPLYGVAILLIGVAFLLAGVGDLTDRDRLGGVAILLGGVAFLLIGVGNLTDGGLLAGVVFLLVGVAGLLVGVGLLTDGVVRLAGVAILLASVAGLLFGIGLLTDGGLLAGVGSLLLGVAGLLVGVGLLTDGVVRLAGVAILLLGVACLLVGIGYLTEGNLLLGVMFLLFGVMFLLFGVAVLARRRARGWVQQLVQYLRAPLRRNDDPST